METETIRAFIALEIPDTIIQEISRVQSGLMAQGLDIKWVRPQSMHLTLNFLGDDTPVSLVSGIRDQMDRAAEGISSFSISVKGVTAFPDLKRPRVVVSEIDGDRTTLSRLKKNLDHHLSSLGFSIETRPFKGHLTLGRIKNRIDLRTFKNALNDYSQFTTEAFRVTRMILFKSDLKPSGPVYQELAQIDFLSS